MSRFLATAVIMEASAAQTPDDLGHTRKVELTTVTAQINGAHTDFPVLFTVDSLPSEMFDSDGANPAQNGGGDIRFTSDEAGTTLLPIEVVDFTTDPNPANGYAEIWCKLPNVRDTQTDSVWCWYNTPGSDSQPAVTEPHGRNAVWSDYALVTHDLQTDSTGNETFSTTGTAAATNMWGKTDGARGFGATLGVGSTDKVDTGKTDHNQLRTYSVWANRNGGGGSSFGSIFRKGTGDDENWAVHDSNNDYYYEVDFSGSGASLWSITKPATDVWKFEAITYDNGSDTNDAVLYEDGSAPALKRDENKTGTVVTNADSYILGNRTSDDVVWDGLLAEFRIFDGIKSAGWVETEWNNQNTPGSFISTGTPGAA